MLLNRITSRSTQDDDDDEKEFVLSGMCTSSITMKSSSSAAEAEASAALVLIKEDTAATMNPKKAIFRGCRMIVGGIMDISWKMSEESLSLC